MPRLVDSHGELIYQCGRRKYPEHEIADQIDDGKECGPAYASARAVASDGYGNGAKLPPMMRSARS